jgi:hypothetical protein
MKLDHELPVRAMQQAWKESAARAPIVPRNYIWPFN